MGALSSAYELLFSTAAKFNVSCVVPHEYHAPMMTSSNGNIFRVTGHLCGNSPVNSLHKGQWCGALMFSLICVWIKGWENNCEAGDPRRYRAHYDVIAMISTELLTLWPLKDIVVLKIWFSKSSWRSSISLLNIPLVINKHWLKQWFGAAKKQTITWANCC